MSAKSKKAGSYGSPNILLFVMDTQRVNNLSCYGYEKRTSPNVDKVAAEGTLFLNNISPGVWTVPAHASIFTGKYVSGHGASGGYDLLTDEFPTLAEVLGELGYTTVGFSNNSWISTAHIERGFEKYVDVSMPGPYDEYKQKPEHLDSGSFLTIQLIKKWFEGEYDRATPFFMFVNCVEPHLRYWPPQHFRERFLDGISEKEAGEVNQERLDVWTGKVEMSSRDWSILRRLYDGETATLDHRMGILFDYLRESNILDDTLLIIISDHGDTQGEHGRMMGHNLCVYQTLIHTPLIIRYPKIFPAGPRVSSLTQSLDIFPTIMDILGVDHEVRDGLQGYSLLTALTDQPQRTFAVAEYPKPVQCFERILRRHPDFDVRVFGRSLKTYHEGQYKYIWASDGKDELYDVEKDPWESDNLIEQKPEKAEEMQKQLEEFLLSLERRDYGDLMQNLQGGGGQGVNMDNVSRLQAWGLYRVITPRPEGQKLLQRSMGGLRGRRSYRN